MRLRFAALFLCFLAWAIPTGRATGKNRAVPPSYDARGLLTINLDFYELSVVSGGDFYFWAAGEFSASGLQIPVAQEPIILVYGRLDRRPRSFPFPVDTLTHKLTVFAGAQRKDDSRLIRPSGAAVTDSDTDIRVQKFRHMLLVTVSKPEVGTWRIELKGAGRFSVSARSRTDHVVQGQRMEPLAVIDFDFVELRGRPGHEGYFPIRREVRAGEDRVCRVVLSGPYETADFEFVSVDAEPLAKLDLALGDPDAASDEFIGPCLIPVEPFRLQVRGRDAWGVEYQRMYSPHYAPKNGH